MAAEKTKTEPVPIKELSRYFRVPSRGIPVDYPGREAMLRSRITNVSSKGVFIQTATPFAAGSTVEITFQLPTLKTPIRATCVVRWSTAGNVTEPPGMVDLEGMGLEFTRISRRGRKAVERYIEEYITRIRSS
jgi:uncharacterized protein (TIGR02266 family)